MKKILAFLVLILSTALPANEPIGSIDAFIDREMPASGAPGLAYAVVSDGEIVHAGGRGERKLGTGTVVTPDTPFITGSVSKSFTALAIMQLVEAGKIELDAEIARYLDAFANKPSGTITVRQLLSHTSGYSTLQGNQSHTDFDTSSDAIARQADLLANEPPATEPDAVWAYSNANYQILGALIEIVSGKNYGDYVETNILQPLGMTNSFVADGEVHEAMATGHRPWFGNKRALAENRTDLGTAPQGGIISTAADLALYMQVMVNGADDIVSAQSKAMMTRSASDASPFYGFGWFLDPEDGTVFHSGSSPGFETLLTMNPAEKKGVVVLVNAGSGIGFGETTQLRSGITAQALGLEYTGEGNRLIQKALFVALSVLPLVFVLSMIWAWRHRTVLRAKAGAFGLFSLWFPLVTTAIMAWVLLGLIPALFDVSFGTLRLFLPDLGLTMIATSITGVLWAVWRLALFYTGPRKDAGDQAS